MVWMLTRLRQYAINKDKHIQIDDINSEPDTLDGRIVELTPDPKTSTTAAVTASAAAAAAATSSGHDTFVPSDTSPGGHTMAYKQYSKSQMPKFDSSVRKYVDSKEELKEGILPNFDARKGVRRLLNEYTPE